MDDGCLRRAAGNVAWLAFLDDDEFLLPVEDCSLSAVLADYDSYAGVSDLLNVVRLMQRVVDTRGFGLPALVVFALVMNQASGSRLIAVCARVYWQWFCSLIR